MGYFSNGTEGMDYQHRYCNRCVHDVNQDCPIWAMHLLHNYERDESIGEDKTWAYVLDSFIPRTNDGLGNKRCIMFVPLGDEQQRASEQVDRDKLQRLVDGRGLPGEAT